MQMLRKIIAWTRIPSGQYCDGWRGVCPFWELRPGKYNAYCRYLGKDDNEIASTREFKDVVTGEIVTAKDMVPGCSSLLWDGCKECGVKDF